MKTRSRLLVTILLVATIPLTSEHFIAPHLAFNHTASMPRGFYWRSAVPTNGPKRGDVVIACAPTAFAHFGRDRGFLDVGSCDGVTNLLKRVVAIAGDRVHLDRNGVTVDRAFVTGSRLTMIGRSRAVVPYIPYEDYVLSARDVWLTGPQAKSFDSRYFGAVSGVLAIARPILVEGGELEVENQFAVVGLPFFFF